MRRVRLRIPRAGGPLALLVVLAVVAVGVLQQSRAPELPTEGLIAHVVDGDTLRVRAGGREHKVRLIGVDTPEAYPSHKLDADARRTKQDQATIMVLGRRASEFTRGLCEGKPCRIELDPENVTRRHLDRYGRLLAFVWVPDAQGAEVLVNAAILREGFGQALTQFPFDEARKAEFLRLQREARAAGRGLWGEWKP